MQLILNLCCEKVTYEMIAFTIQTLHMAETLFDEDVCNCYYHDNGV